MTLRLRRPLSPLFVAATALALGLASVPAISAAAKPPAADATPPALEGLSWRLIGPFRGGRVAAVTGVPGHPRLFYMGAAGGGVWKSTDAGASWASISDTTFGTGSVGAVAVAPSDPNVVYVGMGEETMRGNVSEGDGVYRSDDAGRSWHRIGLTDSRHVSRICVHPTNPDLVYVAAMGHLFGPNAQRGVFRSRDGGRTWERVLHVNDDTGASDLAMDPTNPRILYAGTWRVRREPWSFESGGEGSGLWKSVDGGDTWKRLTDSTKTESGLPKGPLGKVCVAISPARPDRVWAMIEADDGGLFRSDDAGVTWQRVSDDRRIRQRAWYFSRITADPKNPDKLWALNVRLHVSLDGGRTFRPVASQHGDHHDLWIDPDDPARMILGDDGGACVSVDGGDSWTTLDNQPTAQFYRVSTDASFPYRILGAQQDNSTVSIPSRTTGFGIELTDWYDVGGGESGWVASDPLHPNVIYAGSYDGLLTRLDRNTEQERDVNAWPDNTMGAGAEAARYRFQWNYPILFSPNDPHALYAGANVLFRTRNEGQTWEVISPDLTRHDPAKLGSSGGPITKDNTSIEYYATIFAVSESPKQAGVIWAGSDDGLIHLTRDNGASWADVSPKGVPEWAQVNALDASPNDPATCYAALTRYKLDDFRPMIYVTHDWGRTWRLAVHGLPANAFTRVVREDPKKKGLLYAGTETGAWVSFDDGAQWKRLQLGLPAVPVTDLTVRDDDLVAATQGRSFWVLDDLSAVRALADGPPAMPWLVPPRTTVRMEGGPGGGHDAGTNPPRGVIVRYALEAALPDSVPVKLEFLDGTGKPLRAFDRKGEVAVDTSRGTGNRTGAKVAAKQGLNSFAWDLETPGASTFDGIILWGGGLAGPRVAPGRYQVRLTVGKTVRTAAFDVVKDPRVTTTPEQFRAQFELHSKIRDLLTRMHDATASIRDVRAQIDDAVARAKRAGKAGAIADSAKALQKGMTTVEEALYQTRSKSEQDPLNYPIRLNNKLSLLARTVSSADAPPTDASVAVFAELAAKTEAQLARLRDLMGPSLERFNHMVADQQVPAVVPRKPGER